MTAAVFARASAKRVVRLLSSSAVEAVGVDATARIVSSPSLVVAPHPDDETLGCGATIARMRALGTAVDVAFVSDGGNSPRPAGVTPSELLVLRRSEAACALQILGLEESAIAYLGFEDGNMPPRCADIAAALSDLIGRLSPAQVFVTSTRDRHPDHRAVALAARVAVSRQRDPVALYEYPIWQRLPAVSLLAGAVSNRRSWGSLSAARPALIRTNQFLEQKRRAISVYESQLPHFPLGFVEDFLLPFETFSKVPLPLAEPSPWE